MPYRTNSNLLHRKKCSFGANKHAFEHMPKDVIMSDTRFNALVYFTIGCHYDGVDMEPLHSLIEPGKFFKGSVFFQSVHSIYQDYDQQQLRHEAADMLLRVYDLHEEDYTQLQHDKELIVFYKDGVVYKKIRPGPDSDQLILSTIHELNDDVGTTPETVLSSFSSWIVDMMSWYYT